jgi:hypothetical protein
MKSQDLIFLEDFSKSLAKNAAMLARQCNLAREAETKMMAERSRCLKAVDDEPEWSENAPEHYGVLEKMFKANLIKETKKNIRKRIEE